MTKSAKYISRMLREVGVTKPKRDTVASLRQEIEQLEKRLDATYRQKALLEEGKARLEQKLAIANQTIQHLCDEEHARAQRNSWGPH